MLHVCRSNRKGTTAVLLRPTRMMPRQRKRELMQLLLVPLETLRAEAKKRPFPRTKDFSLLRRRHLQLLNVTATQTRSARPSLGTLMRETPRRREAGLNRCIQCHSSSLFFFFFFLFPYFFISIKSEASFGRFRDGRWRAQKKKKKCWRGKISWRFRLKFRREEVSI